MASIYQSIEILSKEKGINPQIVVDAVKDAMLLAARKQFKGNEDLAADFDMSTGNIVIYAIKTVVETVSDSQKEIRLQDAVKLDAETQVGGTVHIPKPTESLGRISAQLAKQTILQKVREAERENIFAEFSHRVGDIVNCTVKRTEGMDLVVDLGKTEARLPKKEQSRLENFEMGERFRCVIKAVEKTGKNSGVVVSRGAPEFVMRLFEQEVPEIYDGTVLIRGCAREAGERTKIAVLSKDRDVDCVGACVGMKGMRVQAVIRELRGEKIDIIEYNDDPLVFATHALSPAKISRVTILDSAGRHMEVIVADSQLSLAIGKKGQNVRLAAKLLGWRIDIKTEEEKRQEVEAQMASMAAGTPVSVLIDQGLTEQSLELLVGAGAGTVEKLASMTPEELLAIEGIDDDLLGRISGAVNAYYQGYEEAGQPETQSTDPVLESPSAGEPVAEAGSEAGVEAAPVEAANAEPLTEESDTIEASGHPANQ